MNYRLRMLIQLAGSAALLAFVPSNVARLLLFPIWWLLTFRRLTRRELVLYVAAGALFTVLDYMTLSQKIFEFTHPDFLLMPCYEPLLWGYLLLHTLHMVDGPTPGGNRWLPVAWTAAFTLPFLVLTNPVVLFAVSGAVLLAGLAIFRGLYDFAYVGYLIFVGAVWEYTGVWSGQWHYPGDPPGGVAPWFVPMWGGIALALRRLILPMLRPAGKPLAG
ncbi:MAG TPA: hypothetical protein VFW33_02320 [Gemmataceae bacterium]|nr:hypothetical protein [Gemmataceae bacterium]